MSADQSLLIGFASNQLQLEHTQPLETFPPGGFRKELAALYMVKGPKKSYRPLASVLNAAVTEGKTHFTLTKKTVADLMSEDPNLEHRSLDGKTYNEFMARMQATGMLEEVHRYTKAEGGGWLAGAYRVAHPLVLKCMAEIHGTEALEQHEKRFLSNYGKGKKSSHEYENENDSEPESKNEAEPDPDSEALVSKPKKNIVRDEAETEIEPQRLEDQDKLQPSLETKTQDPSRIEDSDFKLRTKLRHTAFSLADLRGQGRPRSG